MHGFLLKEMEVIAVVSRRSGKISYRVGAMQ